MNDDPTLRELFRPELERDEAGAPDFGSVWSAAVARHHRRRRRALAAGLGTVAAAIALAVLVPPVLHRVKTSPPAAAELPWRSAVLLTEWRAPTDAFLPGKNPSLTLTRTPP